jgi:hypothetical protein
MNSAQEIVEFIDARISGMERFQDRGIDPDKARRATACASRCPIRGAHAGRCAEFLRLVTPGNAAIVVNQSGSLTKFTFLS